MYGYMWSIRPCKRTYQTIYDKIKIQSININPFYAVEIHNLGSPDKRSGRSGVGKAKRDKQSGKERSEKSGVGKNETGRSEAGRSEAEKAR